jgi:hypothetical protein
MRNRGCELVHEFGPKMQTLLTICFVALALGCVSTPVDDRVQNYGHDTYIVTHSSIFRVVGKARNAAIRDANAFCSEKGAPMRPTDQQISRGRVTTVSLVFICSATPRATTFNVLVKFV